MREFISIFQIDRMTIFEVRYYTLRTNKKAYFSTLASHFIKSKKDYDVCGQAQEYLLKHSKAAYSFYKKYDVFHCQELTEKQFQEMLNDLEKLKNRYNYLYKELDENQKPYSPRFSFSEIVELSKQNPKKIR